MKNFAKIIIAILVIFFIAKSCKRSSHSSSSSPTPIAILKGKLKNEQNYSIILEDMDAKNLNTSSEKYLHKYQILKERKDTVLVESTEWYPVTSTYFNKHINDLGMELVTKENGKIHDETVPPGYRGYVGNSHYGEWRHHNGHSFWAFYGRYMFLSQVFNRFNNPYRRDYYDDYQRNYNGRSYYGPNGRKVYGTSSYTGKSSWTSKDQSFKNRVRSQVKISSARRARNASRSSRSTSYRSRSGGFGK